MDMIRNDMTTQSWSIDNHDDNHDDDDDDDDDGDDVLGLVQEPTSEVAQAASWGDLIHQQQQQQTSIIISTISSPSSSIYSSVTWRHRGHVNSRWSPWRRVTCIRHITGTQRSRGQCVYKSLWASAMYSEARADNTEWWWRKAQWQTDATKSQLQQQVLRAFLSHQQLVDR